MIHSVRGVVRLFLFLSLSLFRVEEQVEASKRPPDIRCLLLFTIVFFLLKHLDKGRRKT